MAAIAGVGVGAGAAASEAWCLRFYECHAHVALGLASVRKRQFTGGLVPET